ncbi:MAG: precorrin-4 C(11)-methyltransferase [Bacteroidaceae bacterium]|nr:precorrin-4 C(11)-methyltransferase [Bacteroidaceae bacterium]
MVKIAIIQISEAGNRVAQRVQQLTGGELIARAEVEGRWHDYEAFVFVGALGICVRTIAPLIEDKHSDPAVLCIDTLGYHVISVLSGHVGGANRLTELLSEHLSAHPVITTQSDLTGLWALDCLDQQFGWHKLSGDDENRVLFAFVNRRPVALILGVRDEGTDYLEQTCPEHVTIFEEADWDPATAADFEALVFVSFRNHDYDPSIPAIHYIPRVLSVGIGLAHQAAPAQVIWGEIYSDLWGRQDLLTYAVREFATIDVKADEPVIRQLQEEGFPVRFYTADELAQIEVPTPSDTVARHVGTASVSEAAALLASEGGELLVEKQKGEKWTYAVAIERRFLREGGGPGDQIAGRYRQGESGGQGESGQRGESGGQDEGGQRGEGGGQGESGQRGESGGHIEIVGAGPGDPDLVSVRGRRFLEQADLILYAGSLVPKALTECHKAGAVVRSSADMALEEQCVLMKEHYDKGHLIVRLHTGDPCIFGAIQEQMAFFDAHGMSYHITPGISSFLAAAAELRSQFTIPERTQTIILTRGEGRTPMPDREKLHLLARSQSTMCIFLSAAIVDDVQKELLQEYPADTPVAACYHLTWPDQHIYRGKLKDLAQIVHDNHLTLTTMLVVGEAIDNRRGLSELYNKHFTHLFRKGVDS